MGKGMSGRPGRQWMWGRRRRRAPHEVGERCTSTPHDQPESAQRGHAQQGHAQQVHATRAWEAQGAQRKHAQQAHAQQVHATRTTQACTAGDSVCGRFIGSRENLRFS